jgi:transposase-like protein
MLALGRLESMRGKDYNTGLRGVLFEQRHYERMGAAIWLYGWLVLRQTHQQGSLGWVLGGAPVSYREIEEETGFNPRTLERWMRTLRRQGYVETESAPGGIVVRITKAKKSAQVSPQARKAADGLRKAAGSFAQKCVAVNCKASPNQEVARPIGSSFIETFIEKQKQGETHRDFHSPAEILRKIQLQTQNPSLVGHNQTAEPGLQPPAPFDGRHTEIQEQQRFLCEARRQQQLLRAEREEAVRREVAAGTGPEVRRS